MGFGLIASAIALVYFGFEKSFSTGLIMLSIIIGPIIFMVVLRRIREFLLMKIKKIKKNRKKLKKSEFYTQK